MRAILSTPGGRWHVRTDTPEPWRFGEQILSKVIRYRGDLDALASDLASGSTRAWVRLGERGDAAEPADGDWLYVLDPNARTLQITGTASFPVFSFNERGRSEPVSIERPASPWGDLPDDDEPPTKQTLAVAAFVADHFAGRPLPAIREALLATLQTRLGADARVVFPIQPGAAYVGAGSIRYPTQAWRDAGRWQQRSPNELVVWRPPHDEETLDVSPARIVADLAAHWDEVWGSPSELTYALIAGRHVAAGGKGDLKFVHAPLPERQWTVVEKGGDPERHIPQKDKRIKKKKLAIGARFARDVDCPGWQWLMLDWLRATA